MIINWDLLKKSISGSLSLRERQTLERWLDESESHRSFYETVRKHYAAPVEKLELSDDELSASWQRFTHRAKHKSGRLLRLRQPRLALRQLRWHWGSGTLSRSRPPVCGRTGRGNHRRNHAGDTFRRRPERILLNDKEQDSEGKNLWPKRRRRRAEASDSVPAAPEQIRIEIPKGGEYRLRLPDGTTVWLNAETEIVYPSEFVGEGRAVTLCGEAFFDVTRDPAKPFTITTADRLEITVLGTRFNVSNYLDVDRAQVTLVEGSLSVADGDRKVTLRPGAAGRVRPDRPDAHVPRRGGPLGCCAWTNGMFDFKLQPLETIFDAVSKWYDIRIVYDPAAVARFSAITLQCDRRSDFTHVMEILQEVTALHYRTEGRTVYIAF